MQDLIKGELDWHNKVNANFHEFDSRIDTKSLLESTGYGVISGLEVNAQDIPNMTVKVNVGIVHMPNGVRLAPEGNSSLAVNASDSANPRIDIIYVNVDSSIGYLAGTPSSTPSVPITPEGAFLLAQINIVAGATTITNINITDKRKMKVTTEYLNNTINEHKADYTYQTAGGTATAIILTNVVLEAGHPKTFIAKYTDSTTAKTINGKKFYKPNTTTSPSTVAGKAYTVWYDPTGDNNNGCFFIKASAEGNATTGDVLAGKTFSSDNDTGLVGTLVAYQSGNSLNGSKLTLNPNNALTKVAENTSFPDLIYSICESGDFLFVVGDKGVYKVNKSNLQIVAQNLNYRSSKSESIQVVGGKVFVNVVQKLIWLQESDLSYIGGTVDNVYPDRFIIDINNNRVFIAIRSSGITIYSYKISDGTEISSANTSLYYAIDLFIYNGYLYVFYMTSIVKLPLDLSSYSQCLSGFTGNVVDVVSRNNGIAYAAQSTNKIIIADVNSSQYIEDSSLPQFNLLQSYDDFLYGTYDYLEVASVYKIGFDLTIKKSYSYPQRYVEQSLAIDQDFVYFAGNDRTNSILTKFEKNGTYQIK